MPYATQTDLLQRVNMQTLIQLTDDAGAGAVNATIVSGALESASGRVDSYSRNRYVTPLQQSDTITEITADIALYGLFSRRPGQMQDTVRQRYEDAMAMLKDVSAGKASFDQPVSAATPQSPCSGAALPTSNDLRFTDCDLEGFV